jgi:hypothetical protein
MPVSNKSVYRPSRKLCSALALCAALILPEAAQAVVVLPGQQVALSGTTYSQRQEIGGLVLADVDRPFSFSDGHRGLIKGYLQDRVVLSGADLTTPGTGTLIFYQRIVLDSNSSAVASINGWSRSNFTAVTTDVDYKTDGVGDLGSSTAQCSVTGNSIQFNLPREVNPGESTYFHMILTNATGYQASGKTTLMAPGLNGVTLTTFQPVGTPQPYYTATPLGSLSDTHINSRGQVSMVDAATSLPELWNPAVPNGIDGTTVSLPVPAGYIAADLVHINSNGWIAGTAYTQAGSDPNQRASIWKPTRPNGTTYTVSTLKLYPGDTFSQASGINDAGEVVGGGGSEYPSGGPELWKGGAVSAFVTLPYGDAYAINKAGEIAAEGDFLGSYQGFLWTPSSPDGTTGTTTTIFSVGGSNYTGSGVTGDVNDSGVAIGYAVYGGNSHGYLWAGNTVTDLGVNVAPYGINNADTVVGSVAYSEGFLYRKGAMTDLNYFVSPADQPAIYGGQDINASEQIVAWGVLGGANTSMLLTPVRIASVSPSSAAHGSSGVTLTVKGLGYLSGANLLWNATPLSTTRINSDELMVNVPASALSSPGVARLQVINPDGTYSSVGSFTVK